MALDTAARMQDVTLPSVAEHARSIAAIASQVDVVLVEGAGGLLVHRDSRGGTLADLGTALRHKGISAGYVLVASPSLGTLNHTALTAEALATRDLPLLGVVVGSYPAEPGLAERLNLDDLPRVAKATLLGLLPEGAGTLTSHQFVRYAPDWLRGPSSRTPPVDGNPVTCHDAGCANAGCHQCYPRPAHSGRVLHLHVPAGLNEDDSTTTSSASVPSAQRLGTPCRSVESLLHRGHSHADADRGRPGHRAPS